MLRRYKGPFTGGEIQGHSPSLKLGIDYLRCCENQDVHLGDFGTTLLSLQTINITES